MSGVVEKEAPLLLQRPGGLPAVWLCRARLLAQLSGSRAPQPFPVATVWQSQGLGVLTMGSACPGQVQGSLCCPPPVFCSLPRRAG